MIKKLSDDDLEMVVGGFEDIVRLPGEGPGGPSYPPDPGQFEWSLCRNDVCEPGG